MSRRFQVAYALGYGVVTHAVFATAVVIMVIALYRGLNTGIGTLHGGMALIANALLLVQFPVLHSFFLTTRGRALMARFAPAGLGKDLATTTFVLIASLQLMAAFLFWTPSGVTIYAATGKALWFFWALYLSSWIFLIKALTDAGLGIQMGYLGWTAVVRGKKPDFGTFPTHGLFRLIRHPVYLGFALVMWTAPNITLDGLLLASSWTTYCLIGPLLKEHRYSGWYGEKFARYRAAVPYFLPRLKP